MIEKDDSFLLYKFNEELDQLEDEYTVLKCDVNNGKVRLTNSEFMESLLNKPLIHNRVDNDIETNMIQKQVEEIVKSEDSMMGKFANGWQSFTSYNSPGNLTFTSFLSYFNTPLAPLDFTDFFAVDYLFPGLQNDNWIPMDDHTPEPHYRKFN